LFSCCDFSFKKLRQLVEVRKTKAEELVWTLGNDDDWDQTPPLTMVVAFARRPTLL